MIRLGGLLALVLALAGLASCAGTETGNPPASDPALGVFPPDEYDTPVEVDADALDRADQLASVWLSLARVELVPVGACDPLATDPSAAISTAVEASAPVHGTLTVPPGTYCAVRFWPEITADALDVPELLRGHSLALLLENEAGMPYVVLQSDRTAPIVLWAAGAGFTVGPDPEALEVLVDPAGALVEQQFWTEPVEADGSYLFTEGGDATFLRAFEGSQGFLRLFRPPSFDGAGGGAGGIPDGGGTPTVSLGTELATSGTSP